MMGNAKEIFCTSNPGHAQLFVCVAMVGQLKGLGLDIPATYVERIEASMVELAAWIRMTCIAVHTGADNIDTQLFALFDRSHAEKSTVFVYSAFSVSLNEEMT